MIVRQYPTVGIVTPAYNAARFLSETIDSVLAQDYPHIDYIIMDGGSSDGTLEILKSYGSRVRYVSEVDAGQADAINRGFHKTRGQVFSFLNADDAYLPGAVSMIARHFMENPGVGLVYGEAYHVRENGGMIDRYPTLPFDAQRLSRECFICQPAAFMLRKAFARAGLMDVNLHYALDYELWMRISKIYPVLKVDEYVATSRMHLRNKTLRHRRELYRETFSVLKAHYGYVPFPWATGYACHLIDGKDQFFDRSRPTPVAYALSLMIGSRHNWRRLGRFWREWASALGLGRTFTGRWKDGWISRLYESEWDVGDNCEQLIIKGRHKAGIRGALRVTAAINGREIDHIDVVRRGPFEIRTGCPPEFRGRRCQLTIVANKTFRPMKGDYRRLSCVIDSVQFGH